MSKHKHHEAITAWANGETIEWSFDGRDWKSLNNNEPRFDEMLKYRVKPYMPELFEFAEKRLGLDLHGQTFADLLGLFEHYTSIGGSKEQP